MEAPPVTSALARPRRTQDEIDEHYEQHPDGSLRFADFSEAQLTELEELEQGLEASSKFLLGSAGWVDQLERVRGEFRHCCLLLFRQQGRQNELRNFNVKAEHNDDLFFPHGHEALLTHVKFYLIWAVKNIKGVRRGSTAPRMLTIIRRRYAIYCWVRMKLSHPPVYTVWQVRTNQAMAFATKKYGINTEEQTKSFFGRHELNHLIDFDMGQTTNIAVAENFHLSWIFGCICGVRPGALGYTQLRPSNYMKWRHITITRDGVHKYKFHVKARFVHMKGFEGKPGGTLEINIRAPENAENIYIAPANRLLIILLRRGFLQQHTTLSSLFEGNDFEILIAKEHLDKPVFLKLKSRSYLSDADLAASAHSMTDYLNLRAVAAGYPNGATMYAWRRKAGTLIDRALGRDAARVLMNHDAGSKTFERHYEEKTLDLVCATIVYGEDVEKAKQDMIANNTERLFRINIKMSKQQQEDFISRYVDENLQLGSEVNMRAERQRLRRLARLAIRKAAVDYHRQTFTRDEFAERAEALGDPTAFNRNLSERVRPLLEEIRKRAATGQPELDLDEEDDGGEDDAQDVGEQTGLFFGDEGDDYNDSDLSETDMSPPEQESSSVLVENSSGAVRHFVVDTDRGDDLDKISQLPYAVTVYQFFSMMLEKALLPGEPRQCDECLADPTVSAEEKQRLWRSASALQNHLKTQFHSLKKKFQRHLTIERESADTKKWQCPLASCEEAFNSMDGVMQHLHALLEAKDQEDPHHEEMVKAGWYSINWEQTAAAKKAVKLQPSTTGARKEISNLKKRPMLEYLSAPQPAQPWNSPYVLCGPRSEDVTLLQHAAIVNMDILATPKSFEGVPGVLTGDQQQASLGEITERSERGSGVLWGEGFKRFKSLSKY